MAESITVKLLADDQASGAFVKTGRAAAAASDDVLGLAKRLDEVGKKSATARVSLSGDKEAMAQLDKLDMKALTLGRRVIDPNVSVEGVLKSTAELNALELQLDKLGATSEKTTESVGISGLSGASGMGALIGAGVALSPVIATLATGLAGFGLAAYGAAAPIEKAAQATGGLAKNMHTLSPEQQELARSILGVQKQYDAFSKSLQPEVLSVFGKGVRIASGLMHDMEPVAKSTGIALNNMLGAIDAEFHSGTWQSFFGFMSATAAPDMKLLSNTFVEFMQVLPELLRNLQPVALGLIQATDDTLRLTDAAIRASQEEHNLAMSAQNSSGWLGKLAHAAGDAFGQLEPGVKTAQQLWQWLSKQADASDKSATSLHKMGLAAATTAPKTQTLAQQVTALTTAMQANIGETLTLQGDTLGLKQAQQAALTQMRSNTAGLAGNSKNALANQAAVLAASQSAQTLANEQLTKLHPNLQLASKDLQDQIAWLQKHGDKSAFATREIHQFRLEEAKIQATIRQRLLVTASGFWKITGALPGGTQQPGTHIRNAGGSLITAGTTSTADDVPVLVSRGETIVPAHLTPAIAPLMKAHGIRGFAQGGVIGSHSGGVPGLTKWMGSEDSATLRALEDAVARATFAGIRAASSGGGGFGGIGPGGSGPNVAIGQRMAASIGWTGNNWAFLRSGWQEESGWNQHAQNPAGTPYTAAYGIPQSNPGSKMAAAGPNWLNDPATQIRWGLGYIRSTYGSPTGVPHWSASGPTPGYVGYDRGGFLPRGASMAVNNTGRPERVLSGSQEHGIEARLDEVIRLLRAGPAATGHAMARGLQGTARTAGARGMYSARGAWA